MDEDTTPDQAALADLTARLQAELREVDKDLAAIRETVAQLRASVGEAEDPADRGALIHAADEQDNLADQLDARRERLLRRIAESG
jgi:hypothetical protein